jgi:hypothetical protein
MMGPFQSLAGFVMSMDGLGAIAILLSQHLNIPAHRMPFLQEQLASTSFK